MTHYDVAVVGAGPAGMSAAIESARWGFSTVLFDEQAAPGGQIYRAVEHASPQMLGVLGDDYASGKSLVAEFRDSGAVYLPGATVWNIGSELQINFSRLGTSSEVSAGSLIVASGAVERPTPMPGWTLPGVVTAGACQILLKAHGLIDDNVIFIGSGPLLWLISSQMIVAGRKPTAIVETVPLARYGVALRKLSLDLTAIKYLRKGAAMMWAAKRAGVPIYRDAREIAIEGTGRAEAVSFHANGQYHRLEASLFALHQGVVPNQQITRLLQCEHEWNQHQRCFVPVLDSYGEESVSNVFVVGDGAGIGGAKVAALQGRRAAKRIAQRAGEEVGTELADLQTRLSREMTIRPFLETLYAPSAAVVAPADTTTVCRCEEMTAGQIRQAVDIGVPGPNQVKSLLRSGMGPCQGRMCGLAVAEIIAQRQGGSPCGADYYRIRPPLKPLPLSELASFNGASTDSSQVQGAPSHD